MKTVAGILSCREQIKAKESALITKLPMNPSVLRSVVEASDLSVAPFVQEGHSVSGTQLICRVLLLVKN